MANASDLPAIPSTRRVERARLSTEGAADVWIVAEDDGNDAATTRRWRNGIDPFAAMSRNGQATRRGDGDQPRLARPDGHHGQHHGDVRAAEATSTAAKLEVALNESGRKLSRPG